jgi:hypothetical protein
MTLVDLSDADRETLKILVAEHVMAEFTAACGADCVQRWNETVGAVVDIELEAAQ